MKMKMMENSFSQKIELLLVVLTFFLGVTSAIECFKCNSEYDPRCGDPMNPYSLGTVNCSMVPPLEHMPEMQSTICRKTVQKTYGKVRVIRECGYVTDDRDDKECVKRLGTHDVQALYCACSTDFCNGADSQINNKFVTVIFITALILSTVS